MAFYKHKRQDKDIWAVTRERIWERDKKKCIHCGRFVALNKFHCDHIIELSKNGTNKDNNLRTLCPTCHVLRKEFSHQGMIAKALKEGWIDENWRDKVW